MTGITRAGNGKKSPGSYKNIIWDWNGTLFDDLAASVKTLNRMLETRALPPVAADEYRERFGFPVRPYYESLGFDFSREEWRAISAEYVAIYSELARDAALTGGIELLLPAIQRAGVRQYVLSALKEELLEDALEHRGIRGFFDAACGVDNIHADGKLARGRRMLEQYPIDPGDSLLIGDTVHDAEVAGALGLDVLLHAGGHNSPGRLLQKGTIVHQLTTLIPEFL